MGADGKANSRLSEHLPSQRFGLTIARQFLRHHFGLGLNEPA